MKRFNNEIVKGYNGKPIMWNIDGKTEELMTLNAFYLVLNGCKMLTQKDSIEGAKLALALDKSKDEEQIEVEESTHDWFKLMAEKLTPSIFGVNGNVVYLLIKEGFIKDEIKGKKGG
jgi:hypothetical protein